MVGPSTDKETSGGTVASAIVSIENPSRIVWGLAEDTPMVAYQWVASRAGMSVGMCTTAAYCMYYVAEGTKCVWDLCVQIKEGVSACSCTFMFASSVREASCTSVHGGSLFPPALRTSNRLSGRWSKNLQTPFLVSTENGT